VGRKHGPSGEKEVGKESVPKQLWEKKSLVETASIVKTIVVTEGHKTHAKRGKKEIGWNSMTPRLQLKKTPPPNWTALRAALPNEWGGEKGIFQHAYRKSETKEGGGMCLPWKSWHKTQVT